MPDVVPETYTFVRERSSGGEDWDPDGRLQLAVALSRLVHPTSIALEQPATFAKCTGLRFALEVKLQRGMITQPTHAHVVQILAPDDLQVW
jgi:hypothetical protein